MKFKYYAATVAAFVLNLASMSNFASVAQVPEYKPFSASDPVAITSNGYGQSTLAPNALGIGEIAPDFRLPAASGGFYQLDKRVAEGPVVIIFYRGHW